MLLYLRLTFHSNFVTTVMTELVGRNLVPMFNPVIAVIFVGTIYLFVCLVILSLTLELWGKSWVSWKLYDPSDWLW